MAESLPELAADQEALGCGSLTPACSWGLPRVGREGGQKARHGQIENLWTERWTWVISLYLIDKGKENRKEVRTQRIAWEDQKYI